MSASTTTTSHRPSGLGRTAGDIAVIARRDLESRTGIRLRRLAWLVRVDGR
jgi:hypothetical protein